MKSLLPYSQEFCEGQILRGDPQSCQSREDEGLKFFPKEGQFSLTFPGLGHAPGCWATTRPGRGEAHCHGELPNSGMALAFIGEWGLPGWDSGLIAFVFPLLQSGSLSKSLNP